MRLNEIGETKPKNLGLVVMHLEKYASQAIGAYKQTDDFLYRGHSKDGDIIIVNPLKNRKPTSTPMRVQNLVDDKLRAARFKALRSNSLFCTSSLAAAENFSETEYLVFPLNGFKFTWSQRIKDFTLYFEVIRDEQYNQSENFIMNHENMPAEEFIKRYGFRQDGFVSALKSKNEIYVCGKCVLINNKFEDEVRDILGMDTKSRMDHYSFGDTDHPEWP
jgi:hypothetical protein